MKSLLRRLRNRGPREEKNPLREFVYLDEVSVTSLVSSRLGAVPSEITDTLSESTRAEVSSGLEASAKALKANLGSVLESTRTQDRQVLRKATIQATFRDLFQGERERDSLVMRSVMAEVQLPRQNRICKIIADPAASAKSAKWVVGREQLQRGSLVEVTVELQADLLFHVSAFVSSFLDMFAGSEMLAGQVDQGQVSQGKDFNGLLEKLLVGLVPIKSRLVDYQAVIIGEEEYLLHRRIIEQLPEADRPEAKDVYLVGVAEQDLFWKDIRRVLFSKARVKVLCRLNHIGVRPSWNAVKLADMIDDIVPGFADTFSKLGNEVMQTMKGGAAGQTQAADPHIAALVEYSDLLAQEANQPLNDAHRAEISRIAREQAHRLVGTNLLESRLAFQEIAAYLERELGFAVDHDIRSDLRLRARAQAGLDEDSSTQPTNTPSATATSSADDRYLDAEIIAIYW